VAQRLERRSLEPDDYELLKVVIDTVCFLSRLVQQKATSIQRVTGLCNLPSLWPRKTPHLMALKKSPRGGLEKFPR
jgi:hypothetical protein